MRCHAGKGCVTTCRRGLLISHEQGMYLELDFQQVPGLDTTHRSAV